MYKGKKNGMLRLGTITSENEMNMKVLNARSIRDAGASGKRKESHSYSSSGKKPKASSSQGFQSRGHQGQGQARAPCQAGQAVCYFCHQPGHMKRDWPQRQGSQSFGTAQSQSSVGQVRTQFVPPPPVWVRGTSISPRVLYEHLLPHRQARGVKAWVKALDRAHRLGHQGFRDVSMPSYHRLSQ